MRNARRLWYAAGMKTHLTIILTTCAILALGAAAAPAGVLYDSEAHGGPHPDDWSVTTTSANVAFADGAATMTVGGNGGEAELVIGEGLGWGPWRATVTVRFDDQPAVGYRAADLGGGTARCLLSGWGPGDGNLILIHGSAPPTTCAGGVALEGTHHLELWSDGLGTSRARTWADGQTAPDAQCSGAEDTGGPLHLTLSADAGSVTVLAVRVEGDSGQVPAAGASWSGLKARYR